MQFKRFVLSAVLAIAADLPADLREDWLARPNVSALLEG